MTTLITKATTIRLRAVASKVFVGAGGRYDDALYRAWLAERWGVASTLELSEEQARTSIRELGSSRDPGAAPVAWAGRYRGAGSRGFAHRLTQRQADEIARQEDRLGWTTNPRRLAGFARRTLRLEHTPLISSLTKAQATQLITALRRITATDTAPARGARHEPG